MSVQYYNGKRIQTRCRPFYTPNPDAAMSMRVDLPLDKKLGKIRIGPPGRSGPVGLRAAEPLGCRLAKPPWKKENLNLNFVTLR